MKTADECIFRTQKYTVPPHFPPHPYNSTPELQSNLDEHMEIKRVRAGAEQRRPHSLFSNGVGVCIGGGLVKYK